ncbi:MAG: hypothetical protein OHK0012_08950 [Synechococcales cyanobacterium]
MLKMASRRMSPMAPMAYVPTPRWLKVLQRWQRITTLMAGSSVVIVLGLYTGTVYTQQQWNHQYAVWKELERHEQQYELSQESLANALRETAQRTNMVPLEPRRLLRIPIATPPPTPPQNRPDPVPTAPVFFPAGY